MYAYRGLIVESPINKKAENDMDTGMINGS